MITKKILINKVAHLYATGFYVGYLKWSGLWGGIIGVFLAWVLRDVSLIMKSGIFFVMLLLALPAASIVEKEIDKKDPKIIIIDEIIGSFLAVIAFGSLVEFGLGLFLFLLFDRLKPEPARSSQSIKGGLGVVLDDLIAGVYALAIVLLLRFFIV